MNKEERRARRDAEMKRGQKQVRVSMAEGLIDSLQQELDPRRMFTFQLVSEGDDNRKWGVRVLKDGEPVHSENFWVFPTDALKAKIMLLGG